MTGDNRVAIFVDAENLTQWIKQDGLTTFLEEISSIGSVVVRKAYARWTNANVTAHQSTLNRLGFEFIHTFHPVSGKNSADIQITVDVMDYATREDLQCIALATGDSDFSPLFRRLREKGKQVLGVGPRSALSESVKSSCSRFYYTETIQPDEVQDDSVRASAFDDAADALEAALKTFDGPANCSNLKNCMLNIDSAFDERVLGFKSFTDFIRAVDGIGIKHEHNVYWAFFKDSNGQAELKKVATKNEIDTDFGSTEQLRTILRKKGWRAIPLPILIKCFNSLLSIGQAPRSELREKGLLMAIGQITTTDIKKALALLMKAGLVRAKGVNNEGEVLWEITAIPEQDMLWAIDRAMSIRILSGLDERSGQLDKNSLYPLLLSEQGKKEIDQLLFEARASKMSRIQSENYSV